MKCYVIKMKQQGVAIAKRELPRQIPLQGELSIIETKSEDLHRIIKFACLHQSGEYNEGREERLYDPVILWMNEDRFVLSGFERVRSSRGIMDLGQSWLCSVRKEI